ncbi:MAG: hypothetical protein ACRD0X_01510 [Thermoanaerobaculia bacterium]
MPEYRAIEPVSFTEAFARQDESAVHSQAASLLVLGAQLGPGAHSRATRAAVKGARRPEGLLPAEDIDVLRLPALRPTGKRFRRRQVRSRLSEELNLAPDELRERFGVEQLPELAARLDREPTVRSAATLFEASLLHPTELVRVSAAIGYLRLAADPLELVDVLVEGTRSGDELVRELAGVALARFSPDHLRLAELQAAGGAAGRNEISHTGLLVHGTFARSHGWWQPGGDFHTYLGAQVRPDLYANADRFDWSGGYSNAARALGAQDLASWVAYRGLDGLDLFTHSHGGSVAMLATQLGLGVGQLVLLSCPARPLEYLPDFGRVNEVVSIRVHLDLVILIDGGRQRFRHPQIEEHVLPLWFRHSATHDARVWQDEDVPALL